MLKIKEEPFDFKSSFGDFIFTAQVSYSDSGARSLAAAEIERLTRLAALKYYSKNYHNVIQDPAFEMSGQTVRALIVLFGISAKEFADYVGYKKGKISKVVNNTQKVPTPMARLAMEALGLELTRPGAIKSIVRRDAKPDTFDERTLIELDSIRFNAKIS